MNKLKATILKDLRLLSRDAVGLLLMFVMPIVLALLITAIQNSTYELVNNNKVTLILVNDDKGEISQNFIEALKKTELFEWKAQSNFANEQEIIDGLEKSDALIALHIPANFSEQMKKKSSQLAALVFADMGLGGDTTKKTIPSVEAIQIYFHPVLQQSFRQSMLGAFQTALQVIENKNLIQQLYASVDEKKSSTSLEELIAKNQTQIQGISASRNGSRNIPNATQHNIPAWTIFAMFFIVISLGSSIVKEKLNGSFLRLKTLPSTYLISLLSKQITYLGVTLVQVVVIFALGMYLFPLIHLPALVLPQSLGGLLIVSVLCGFCAVSFAVCIGVFAETQEQANGFGAVSIVIMAAIGGLLVPSFAMPEALSIPMKLSPLHWCLEAYYDLFLEGGKVSDIITNSIPLILITFFFILLSFWGLKRKKLI